MQGERDVIRTRVAPALRQVAAEYGQSVRLLDLRWGVNTANMSEEEAAQKVLDVCLDEIDRCEGYMVCLLGNRYGWVPDYERLTAVENRGLYMPEPISVTELEIQYGILQRNQGERSIIFFRDEIKDLPEELTAQFCDPAEDQRLPLLKSRLEALPQATCHHYSLTSLPNGEFDGLEAFAARLLEELTGLVRRIYGESAPSTPVRQRQKLFESRIAEHTDAYLPVPELEQALADFAESDAPFLVVNGGSGTGKSAFAARLYANPPAGVQVLPYLCGATAQRSTPREILTHFIEVLGEEVPSHLPIEEYTAIFSELLNRIQQPVWFVVDSLDALDAPEDGRLDWLPRRLPQPIRFVFTASAHERSCRQLADFWPTHTVVIPELTQPELFMQQQLAAQGKEIPREYLQKVASYPLSHNYLFCDMAVRMLMLINRHDFAVMNQGGGGIDSINSYILQKLEQLPDTMEAMAFLFLFDCGEQITPGLTGPFLSAIACSPMGLRAQDLQALFPELWDEAEFSYFAAFLEGYLVQDENGCYRLSRPLLQEACRITAENEMLLRLTCYLRTLPDNDPIKASSSLLFFLIVEWYEDARQLILANRELPIFLRQIRQAMRQQRPAVAQLLKTEEMLAWFLEQIVPQLNDRPSITAAIKLLEDHAVPGDQDLYIRMLHNLAQLYIKCEDKCGANNILRKILPLAKDEIMEADLRVEITETAFAENAEDVTAIKSDLAHALTLYKKFPPCPGYYKASFFQQLFAVQSEFGVEIYTSHTLWDYIHRKEKSQSKLSYIDTILLAGLKHLSIKNHTQEHEITHPMLDALYGMCDLATEIADQLQKSPYLTDEYGDLLQRIFTAMCRVDSTEAPLEGSFLPGTAQRMELFREQRSQICQDIVEQLTERLRGSCHTPSLKLLAKLQLQLAGITEDLEQRIMYLKNGCSVLERYFSQEPLSDFADELAKALLNLAECYLAADYRQEYEDTLDLWGGVTIGTARCRIAEALESCKRYPDEIHREMLQKERNRLQAVWDEFADRLWLGEQYSHQENLKSVFALAYTAWTRGRTYVPEVCTPETFLGEVKYALKLEKHFEDPNLTELKRTCLPLALHTLMHNAHRILVLLERQLREDAEDRLLRPREFYPVAVTFMDRYFSMLNEKKLPPVSIEIRQVLAFQLAEFQMKVARHCPERIKEMSQATLDLLDTLQEAMPQGFKIPANWMHSEVSKQTIRQLACEACFALGDLYFEQSKYNDALPYFRRALDLCLLLQGSSPDRPMLEELVTHYAAKLLPKLYQCLELLERWEEAKEITSKADILINNRKG